MSTSPSVTRPSRQSNPERLAYSIAEAAHALGVSRSTICTLIRRGELRSIKVGWRRLIPTAEVTRLLEQGTAEE